jgi:hypothetical protein
VRTLTLLILPPTAVTTIPWSGAVSVPPPAGVIDNRTPLAAAAGRPLLPRSLASRVEPPQAAASKPSAAQLATVASQRPRSPDDRKEMSFGIAAGRNSDIRIQPQEMLRRAAIRPPLTELLRV